MSLLGTFKASQYGTFTCSGLFIFAPTLLSSLGWTEDGGGGGGDGVTQVNARGGSVLPESKPLEDSSQWGIMQPPEK